MCGKTRNSLIASKEKIFREINSFLTYFVDITLGTFSNRGVILKKMAIDILRKDTCGLKNSVKMKFDLRSNFGKIEKKFLTPSPTPIFYQTI